MKKLTLITAILLCFALLFVGCTKDTEPTQADETKATEAPAATEAETEEAMQDPEETVDMTAMGNFKAEFSFEDPCFWR